MIWRPVDVTVETRRGGLIGIYLQRGAKRGQPSIKRCDDNVDKFYVRDIVTHVDRKSFRSTQRVADAIIRSGPIVTISVLRCELMHPLVLSPVK